MFAAEPSRGISTIGPAGRPKVVEVAALVLVAALLDQLDRRVAADRLPDEPGQRGSLQLEAVRAGEEADEVGGGVDGGAVEELHRRPCYGPPCHLARHAWICPVGHGWAAGVPE